ncbi:dual specificity protein phosphatase family protein [Oscillatoria salina]|uniref:dual specificity protein phosphatase family protein n=1 Tax=Oscillatoria salina TaxID=331517 RepID=UPI001CCD88D9|nr:dual specificity protein phosphatase [Oscillatoria salina]
MTSKSEFNFARIEECNPGLKSHLKLYMLERFGASVKLTSDYPGEKLKVQLWTNTLTKFNSEGKWHAIDLENQTQVGEKTFIFQGSFLPTSVGEYEFTYRIGLDEERDIWQWVGQFQENGCLKLAAPKPGMNWTTGASYIEFSPGVYVGNFIAASQAEELGFDAVLNLAEELTLTFPVNGKIFYQKMGFRDGAHNPIADEGLLAAVNWIESQIEQGKKVLVNCRAGIGRSGSVSIAYYFWKNSHLSYQETLEYIWSKKADIYPHNNLQVSLERLFPRQQKI